MTATQRLQIRLGQIRERMNLLGSKAEELTDEERSEVDKLTKEYLDCEARHRAAIVTESEEAEQRQAGEEPGGETGEGAEMRRLMERATIGNYVEAALQGTIEHGAERELADALEVRRGPGYVDGVVIPWAMLLPEEHRAATTTSQNDGPVRQVPVIDRLFRMPDSMMDMLGVGLMSSGPGQTEYPLVSAGTLNVGQTAEGADIGDPAAMSFTVETLKPTGRLSGSYELTAELRASVAGIEQALRRDLAMLVEEQMILQVFNGNGTAPNVNGILSRVAAQQTAPTAAAVYGDYVSLGAKAVDGYHASDETDVDILLPIDVYQHAAGVLGTGSDAAAILAMKSRCKRCRATAFLADAPATGESGAGVNTNVVLHSAGMNGGSQRYDSLGVIWSAGPNLIVDRVTKAKSATTILTHVTVWNAYMAFRSGAYDRVSLKLDA